MAACWKGNWKVDPLALSVPLSALLEDPLPDDEDDDPLPPEELQAATTKDAMAAASPTLAARWMRRRCI
jgi:hypothetical protein